MGPRFKVYSLRLYAMPYLKSCVILLTTELKLSLPEAPPFEVYPY